MMLFMSLVEALHVPSGSDIELKPPVKTVVCEVHLSKSIFLMLWDLFLFVLNLAQNRGYLFIRDFNGNSNCITSSPLVL